MTEQPRKRQDVPVEDKWNVGQMYADDAAWEADFADAQGLPALVEAYRGRLGESAEVLGQALTIWFDALRRFEKVYVYAHLRNDEDLSNDTYKGMLDRARTALVRLSTAGSYLSPEILTIDDVRISAWLAGRDLAPYAFWIKDILRAKPHTLTPSEERLLAMVSEPLATIPDIFKVLKNVDLSARLTVATDAQGQEHPLTHATFVKLEESRDRTLRKSAFDTYYGEFAGNRNTNAATLNGAVKTHLFEAQARRHGSALEAALFDDAVPTAVYDALIAAVHEALPSFYRYVALRKRLLGVDPLHIYDTYVPVIPEVDVKFSYDESVEVISAGLQPLGDEYVGVMRDGLYNGWVDRYENIGKRSGAYSSGCYDSMPYILLNHNGTLDACFTLAHELGHSMHSWYANHY
ncbi:MAG: oligoendopeptidase F family protein, partial [Chloroflexi bacterium]|nr:oligoendopeptidase F family protein [Chloroflexota bacterium]